MDAKQRIARRVAQELRDGDIVNLGIGLPTMVANYLPEGIHITLQSENGFLGLGPVTTAHPDLVNAGGQPCGILPGAAMFDSAMSFALIRGGHIDACVLGGLQVDEEANLANWVVPGKMVPGMGGAMDLVTGSRKVIIAMEHCAKDGSAKIHLITAVNWRWHGENLGSVPCRDIHIQCATVFQHCVTVPGMFTVRRNDMKIEVGIVRIPGENQP